MDLVCVCVEFGGVWWSVGRARGEIVCRSRERRVEFCTGKGVKEIKFTLRYAALKFNVRQDRIA